MKKFIITFISLIILCTTALCQTTDKSSTTVKVGEQSTIYVKWDNPKVVDDATLKALTNSSDNYATNLSNVNVRLETVDQKLTQLLTREVDSKLTAAAAKFGLTQSNIKTAINKNNTIIVFALLIPFLFVAWGWYKLLKYREKLSPQDFVVQFIIYAALSVASYIIINKGATALFNHDFTQLQNIKNLI